MNPGERLLHVYNSLVSQSENIPMARTWAAVFGIQVASKKDPHLEDEVTACLVALRAEIALARSLMEKIGAPPGLTSPGFERLRDVAAPSQLGSNWHNHRGNVIVPECRKCFEVAAWALRDESEPSMALEDMQALQSKLTALEEALQQTEMSAYLRSFVERQVSAIRDALRVYSVQGAKPLQEALKAVVGDFTMEGAKVESELESASDEAKGVIAKAGEAITKTAEVCDKLSKIEGATSKAWELGKTYAPLLLPFLKKLVE